MKLVLILTLFIFSSITLSKDWKDVAKITSANLKSHELLYHEGFYIITSTEKTIDYFTQHTFKTAGDEWNRILFEVGQGTHKFTGSFKENPNLIPKFYNYMNEMGKDFQNVTHKGTQSLVKGEWELSKKSFNKAWGSILKGTIRIKRRTQDDFQKLKSIPGNFFSNLKGDFSNMKEILSFLKTEKKEEVDVKWTEGLEQASIEFQKEYEKSGQKENTLAALPHILWGHMKALYYGLFKPSAEAVNEGVSKSGHFVKKSLENVILLPIAATVVFSGRTLYSVAGVTYYSTKMGVNILSPYVEAGFHSAVGLISAISTVPTFIVGEGIGVTGQVALTGAGAGTGVTSYAVATTADTAKYVGKMAFDVGQGVGSVLIDSSMSGVVLGYNAITSIPAHLVTGTVNAVFFLVYDGPRLTLAWARGEFKDEIRDLPVGSVIDMTKLKEKGIKVETLTDDPNVIKEVIQNGTKDLR